MAAIHTEGLTKRFGEEVLALDELDLTVEDGEIFGFLGPNGAGKSTTISILLGFARPTAGTATVLGRDPQQDSQYIRARTGVLPEGYSLYDRLTAREHLQFAVRSMGVDDDPEALVERVGLGEAIDRKVGGFSKGMTQRLALAAALVGDPDLLILDEPSTGLDPAAAQAMRDLIREEADRGTAVFFSSHILGQVEAICDRVGILQNGRLAAEDTVEGLRNRADVDTHLSIDVERVPDGAIEQLRSLSGVMSVNATERVVTVDCQGSMKTDVLFALEDAGASVQDFSYEETSLEDLFMTYTSDAGETGTNNRESGQVAAQGMSR